MKLGTKHELKEHGEALDNNEETARKIALDHIKEHPHYYTDLKAVKLD